MALEILVAEDDNSWQGFYKLLKSEQVNITVVDNLKSAVKTLETKNFDLYITSGCYPAKLGAVVTPGICFIFYHRIMEMKSSANILLVAGNDHGLSDMDNPLNMTYIPKKDAHKIIPAYIQVMRGKKQGKGKV